MKAFVGSLLLLVVVDTISALSCRQQCKDKPSPTLCVWKCRKARETAENRDSFIVGGSSVNYAGNFPFQASLQYQGSHICGASVIGDQHVLTAAHCFNSSTTGDYSVVLGLHDQDQTMGDPETYTIDTITMHPSFTALNPKSTKFDNDIAIIRLSTVIDTSTNYYIYPIDLAPNDGTDYVNRQCCITGWGKTSASGDLANTVQVAETDVISNTDCQAVWGNRIDAEDICTQDLTSGTIGPCDGDAGGPLFCKDPVKDWILVGVMSWGQNKCRTTKPSVSMRVSYYNQWIVNNMN